MRTIRHLLTPPLRFWKNHSGNVSMIFAFALIPMLAAIGVAVDYSQAARSRSHISASADAAALAAAHAAQDYLNSYGNGSSQFAEAKTLAQSAADQVFKANQANDNYSQNVNYTLKMTQAADGTAVASISANATAKTSFMFLVGIPTVAVGTSSQAQGAGLTYYQIVFIVDVSNSMAIGGDDANIAKLEADSRFNSSGTCAFACHDSNSTISNKPTSYYCHQNSSDKNCAGYDTTTKVCSTRNGRQNCDNVTVHTPGSLIYCPNGSSISQPIQCVMWDDKRMLAKYIGYKLKIDYVHDALDSFISQLSSTQTKAFNQFRISMWSFGTNTQKVFDVDNTSNSLAAETAYYAQLQTAADGIDLEVATSSAANHGYTQTSSALNTVYNNSKANLPLGDGTSPSSRKTFFIILSDGAEDIPGSSQWGRTVVANYPTKCTTMKNPILAGNDKSRPITFSIEAAYPDVPTSDGDYLQYATLILNSSPTSMKTAIPAAMQGCATPGNYLLAQNGDQIVQAVHTAFANITASLHLTK